MNHTRSVAVRLMALCAITVAGSCTDCGKQSDPAPGPTQLADGPARKLTVELDYASVRPSALTLELITHAFLAADAHLDFKLDRIADVKAPWPKRLADNRDYPDAVHVIIANHDPSERHGTTIYAPDGQTRAKSGVIIFADSIRDDLAKSPLLDRAGITFDHLLARSLAHEIGHALGCEHRSDGPWLMVQSSSLGPVIPKTLSRWRRAVLGPQGEQFPVYAPECIAAMRFDNVLSVDRATPHADSSGSGK